MDRNCELGADNRAVARRADACPTESGRIRLRGELFGKA